MGTPPAQAGAGPPRENSQVKLTPEEKIVELPGLRTNASRYKGRMVRILVGPDNAPFSAHYNVLSQSPFLRRACGPREPELHFKEEEPRIFAFVLEWLYTSQFFPLQSELTPGDQTCRTNEVHQDLIGLYSMAAYFEMNRLQDTVVEKLKLLEPINDEAFFVDAKWLFEEIPAARGAYFDYFDSAAERHIRAVLKEEWMLKLLEEGGPFARALGRVMGSVLTKPEK